MVIYMFGWGTKWSFDPSIASAVGQDRFFSAQADALLRGRLWVDPSSMDGTNECFYASGRCYGYFGLTPSLLRIPLMLIIGSGTPSLASFMVPLAAGVAFGASLDLCRQLLGPMVFRLRGAIFMCVAATTLGPGSVLVLLADPWQYQEAILWAIAGVMVAVNCYWRWLTNADTRLLALSCVSCIFAAGARPSSLLVGVVLGINLLVKQRGQFRLRLRVTATAVGFVLLPALFSLGVLFAKFGQPSPPPDAYRNPSGIAIPRGACDSRPDSDPKYLPTTLIAYLRPDAISLSGDWPYVRFRFGWCSGHTGPTYLWPLKEGDLYVEKTTSLSNTMPIPLASVLVACFAAARRRRTADLVVLTATATVGLIVSGTAAITSRYLGDFYPLLATGLALSAAVIETIKRKAVLVMLTTVGLLFLSWSLLANASLFTLYGWIYSRGL